jgi:peptide-methionine (S)-S-oxide reductase
MLKTLLENCSGFLALLPLFNRGPVCNSEGPNATIPNPEMDIPLASAPGRETMVIAGGCFWGIQAVYEHVRGVIRAISGYSGGQANTAQYEKVCSGRTGHAEAVQVAYDPSRITYGQLLKVFFSVAHDPTQLNRQGPDVGTQYRSAIFYSSEEQKRVALAYIEQLNKAKIFPQPIATQVAALDEFFPAEEYHQDYAANNPENKYIVIHDQPKIGHLRKQFPDLFVEEK